MGQQDRSAAGTETEQTTRRHRGNRHGRSEAARQAVLEAADDLLVAKGFAGVTIEGIAASAGVAKQTIYRWWNTKTEILLEALSQDAAEDLTTPDLGDLDAELRHHLRRVATFLDGSDAGAVFKALLGHAQHDEEFAARLRDEYLDAQRGRDRVPLERAVRRGLLPADTDTVMEADRLMAPIYYRVLVTGEPVDEAFLDGLVGDFLRRFEVADGPESGTRLVAQLDRET